MTANLENVEAHRAAVTGHCYRMLGSVMDVSDGGIAGWNSFLNTDALFPRFGLPLALPA